MWPDAISRRTSRLVTAGVNLRTVQEPMVIATTAGWAQLTQTRELQAMESLVHPGRFRHQVATNWLPTPKGHEDTENRIAFNLLNLNKLK